MKVLHLNSVSSGGAFVAAHRIHHGLLSSGVDSQFLTLSGPSNPDEQEHYSYFNERSFLTRILESIQYRHFARRESKVRSGSKDLLSIPHSPFNLTGFKMVNDADVIHLHWIPGMIDLEKFHKKIRKPIIWTHHDDWINNELIHYESATSPVESKDLFFRIKAEMISSDNVHSISPSKWLFARIKENHPSCHVERIGYGIKLSKYIHEIRVLDPLKILLISESIDDRRKGIISFLNHLDETHKDIEVFIIGKTKKVIKKKNLHFLGFIGSHEKIHELLKQMDVLIIPSEIDNLPNVLIEAMNVGVPAIGFDVGGISDLIIDKQTGLLAKEGDYTRMTDMILGLDQNRDLLIELGRNAKDHISTNYDIEKQTLKYIDFYNQCI